MKIQHAALILFLMLIWGFNFAFIQLGVHDLPPFFMAALRFFLAAVPAVFWVKKPAIKTSLLIAFGLAMFALQFSFLFTAIRLGMTAGLASLVLQCQVFFTMGLAHFFFKEKITMGQVLGALVSVAGLVVVGLHAQGDITVLGLCLTVCAAFSWGLGNIAAKKISWPSPFALVVWGSLVAFPFLLGASLIFEGPQKIFEACQHFSTMSVISILYIVYVSTHFGYSLWSHFLKIYPVSQVVPFTLTVPAFGFLGSSLLLDESIPLWKAFASFLLIAGICVYFLEGRLRKKPAY